MPHIRRPFGYIDDLFDEEAQLLHKIARDLAVDIYEKEDILIVKMHIPGIDPDRIDITIEEDLLKIVGSREQETAVEDQQYIHREIKRGSFERIIPLPVSVDPDSAQADCKDGVLTVTLPLKRKKIAPAKVKIKKKK